MNEIVDNLLLVGVNFLPEMHLGNLVLLIVHVVHLPETKKELNNLCRQEIHILFTEMNLIRLVFYTIWPMVNQKI